MTQGFKLKVVAFDNIATMRKALGDDREYSASIVDDTFKTSFSTGKFSIVEPPFDLYSLATMPENSSQLSPIIDAMEVNIERLGYRIVPREGFPSEEVAWDGELKRQRSTLKNFFANAVLEATQTFTSLRGNVRRDLETTGCGFVEVLENIKTGKPAGLNHLPSWTMRLTNEDDEFTDCIVKRAVQREDGSWNIEPFPYMKRFRRYVQVSSTTCKAVYFKEWNDPRVINRETGEVIENGSPNDPRAAHSVIYFKLYCTRSAYGLPRWIGSLMPIVGNRAAETINYTTFRNNNIPALMLLATNVNITDSSVARIREFIEQQISGKANYSQILLVEGEPMSEGMRDPGTMKLEIKELTQSQHTDSMFKNYMSYNDDKIRRAFRLPPLLLGDSTDYTRSCYSEDTETLTETGWKRHFDISDDEKIAAYDPTTGEMKFVVPEKKLTYQVEDVMMYHVHGKTTDFMITPEHTVLVSRPNKDAWKSFQMKEMPYGRFDVLTSPALWNGNEVASFCLSTPDECRIEREHDHLSECRADDWLEYLGYFISEGKFVDGDCSEAPRRVEMSWKDEPARTKMIKCFDRLGLKYSSHCDEYGTTRFSISNNYLCEWLKNNIGVHPQDRFIPREYMTLSRRQLTILMDALLLCGGTADIRFGRSVRKYCTPSNVLADQVQQMLVQLGYRASVGKNGVEYRVSFVPKRVATLRSKKAGRLPSSVDRVLYSGVVYCYSVPGYGFFVTRRNGKVAIQGNTADTSKRVAEEQMFMPERDMNDTIWNQTIVPALDVSSMILKTNTPNVTDNYELTQLLSTAERSGGLSPYISRIIVEDVLGRSLPPISSEFPQDVPFTMTMLREQLAANIAVAEANGAKVDQTTKSLSDDDIKKQLEVVIELAKGREGVPSSLVDSLQSIVNSI